MTHQNLHISESSLKTLKEAYKKAVEDNAASFIFQEKELVTGYAKYLIEYLENEFKNGR